MKKDEFLNELAIHLNALPEEEKNERIDFYKEMIEDKVLDGKSEEEAINDLGGVDKVIDDILEETPLYNLVKERIKPKRSLKAWEIVLIILGFPLWFPLVLVFIILCLIGYLLIWIALLIVYAIEIALGGVSIGGFILFIISLFNSNPSIGHLGVGFLATGLAIFLYFGCIGMTKATIKLSKVTLRRIKRMFIKKGE